MHNWPKSNNYTRRITFAKAHLNPKYMRLLKVLIDNRRSGVTRLEALTILGYPTHKLVHQIKRGWNCGPFTLLHDNGYASVTRVGHKCLWRATGKGEGFYNVSRVNKDLLAA